MPPYYNDWYRRPPKAKIEVGSGIRGNKNYGITWWGQQWLNAFTNISDANRLPRGRTYANNGSVRSIDIKDNIVKATVQGSYLYKISVEIPAFTLQEQKVITSLVAENPALLSSLLSRELPPDLYEACEQKNIAIFPKKWTDFSSSCSCPDWASPCKHLAAIIYLLANEIDKNPFVVFSLHRFDLLGALEKEGYAMSDSKKIGIESLAGTYEPLGKKPAASLATLAAMEPDFSLVPHSLDNFLAILTEKPVFYVGGDFKLVLKKAWTQLAKKQAKGEQEVQPSEATDYQYERVQDIAISVQIPGQTPIVSFYDSEGAAILQDMDMPNFMHWLAGIPPGRLQWMSPAVRSLWLCKRFAESCAVHSALVPRLLATDQDNAYLVRWQPALNHETMQTIFAQMRQNMPDGMLNYTVEGKKYAPKDTDYAHAVTAVFLNHLVFRDSDAAASLTNAPIHRLFFSGASVVFDQFETKESPSAMALWLNRFFLREKDLTPMVVVNETASDSFELSIAIENRKDTLAAPVPLRDLFERVEYKKILLEMLRDLNTVAEFLPDLRKILNSKGKLPLAYTSRDFAQILFEKLPVISLLGLRTLLPKSLSKILHPRLSMRLTETPGKVFTKSLLSLKEMLRYDWQVAIGDHDIDIKEFLELLKNAKGLVKIRGEYVYFDEKEMKALAEKLAKPPVLSDMELLQMAFAEEYEGTRISLSAEPKQKIEALLQNELLPLPQGLTATLRPYQHRGFSWLAKNADIGFGSILADDMGLGKTIQVITTLLHLKENGTLSANKGALVVAPTTLLFNWQREIARFAPSLRVAVYHGSNRDIANAKDVDIVLTTYGMVRSDQAQLAKVKWTVVVIDEAQAIKNPTSEQSKAVKKIPALIRIAMSGTPVENRLSEYWSVFDFTNKGYLGKPEVFKSRYAIPIEAERNMGVLRKFKKVTAPFVLRRLKTDKSIISDLPDKVEQNQYCQLAPEQVALYQETVERSLEEIDKNQGIARQGMVLQLIAAMKQICNHPTQFLKKGAADPQLSGKCPILLDLIERALLNDEKMLIFTQFTAMGELLQTMIEQRFGIAAPFLHGGLSRDVRDNMVEGFQNQRANRLLIISIKAGGTGLNLTAASQVVHFDLWWNPAVESQATDRAFRIGQKKNVQVHRFITSSSFEEKIDAMIQSKKELAGLAVASGETWIGDLSTKELKRLFALE